MHLDGSGPDETYGWTATYDVVGAHALQAIDWRAWAPPAGDRLTNALALVWGDAEQECLNPGHGRGVVWLVGSRLSARPVKRAVRCRPAPGRWRRARGDDPDCWDLVGGHVDRGETPEEAVVRECREELGVDVVSPRQVPMPFSDPTLDMHAFLVTEWTGEPVNAAAQEHDDLQWFEPGQIRDLTMAHPRAADFILGVIAKT